MLFPIGQLLEGRDPLICAQSDWTVNDALDLMTKHDFSQLPVVDESGKLVGIITERQLIRRHYWLKGTPILEHTVGQCCMKAATLTKEDDLMEALEPLNRMDSVVVVDEEKRPIGILTHFDTTLFFRDFSEGLMLVQDIEMTLRDRIEAVLPDGQSRTAALFHAFGGDKRNPIQPARQYEELNLSEHIQLITAEKNWPKFEEIFRPKDAFDALMQGVREIRNQITHFRDKITDIQLKLLRHAQTSVEHYPRPAAAYRPGLASVEITFNTAEDTAHGTESIEVNKNGSEIKRHGKYALFADWLNARDPDQTEFRITFSDIEKIMEQSLPPFAEHRSWWANERKTHRQSLAWLGAGWRVKAADLNAHEVTFERIKPEDNTSEDEGTL